MPPSPSALRRMVLVDVHWSDWQPDRDRSRYEQIVRTLVQPPVRSSAELEPVYVHQCYEEDRGDTSWMAPAASYELPPADVCQRPGEWLVDAEGLDHVLAALHEQEATARESGKIAVVPPDSYDAADLRIRVEAWTLRTLLLTERPRDFGPYPLLYLTCLYRVCAAQELKGWRTPDEMANAHSAVGAEELQRVLTAEQYEWFMKQETDLLAMGSGDIYAKLRSSGVLQFPH